MLPIGSFVGEYEEKIGKTQYPKFEIWVIGLGTFQLITLNGDSPLYRNYFCKYF